MAIVKNPQDVKVNENQPSKLACEFTLERYTNMKNDVKSFWNKIVTLSYLKTINGKPHHSKKHTGEREFPPVFGNFSLGDNEFQGKAENAGNAPLTKDQLIEKWSNEFNWDLYDLRWKKDGGKLVKDDHGTFVSLFL